MAFVFMLCISPPSCLPTYDLPIFSLFPCIFPHLGCHILLSLPMCYSIRLHLSLSWGLNNDFGFSPIEVTFCIICTRAGEDMRLLSEATTSHDPLYSKLWIVFIFPFHKNHGRNRAWSPAALGNRKHMFLVRESTFCSWRSAAATFRGAAGGEAMAGL